MEPMSDLSAFSSSSSSSLSGLSGCRSLGAHVCSPLEFLGPAHSDTSCVRDHRSYTDHRAQYSSSPSHPFPLLSALPVFPRPVNEPLTFHLSSLPSGPVSPQSQGASWTQCLPAHLPAQVGFSSARWAASWDPHRGGAREKGLARVPVGSHNGLYTTSPSPLPLPSWPGHRAVGRHSSVSH